MQLCRDHDFRVIASCGSPASRIFVLNCRRILNLSDPRDRGSQTAIPHADGLPPVTLFLSEEDMVMLMFVL